MSAKEVFENAMCQIGPWYGKRGSLNHNTYDVLFAAMNHALANDGDTRAQFWLANRFISNSVGWLESHPNYEFNLTNIY